MIKANNPDLSSWVEVPENSDFPIQNLPFGIFSVSSDQPRVGVAIGAHILDLKYLQDHTYFRGLDLPKDVFAQEVLNDFIALGRPVWRAVRERISELLQAGNEHLWLKHQHRDHALIPQAEAQNHLPVKVGDYTDFYSSIEHATNVGMMFRDPENALLPNWKHIPVGYHGRASSIVVSGTEVRRPKGQTMPAGAEVPVYGPSRLLDFELEMAFVVGKNNELGDAVSTAQAEEHIFGMLLFNDWSARDIQKWEYVPLGPFLGKSFASTVSPWIVTLDAFEPFRLEGATQDPKVLPYLEYEGKPGIDIDLEVAIECDAFPAHTVSRSNYKYMYWNMWQQLAHHTVNGCNLRVGDLCASGTISGSTPDSYGSMLELSWRGTKPLDMPDGSQRKFIQDGDTVILKGFAQKDGVRVGFGECRGKVLPAKG